MSDKKIKLLVVDDEALLRMSMLHIFTEFGHSVRSAEDGFTALNEIRNDLPDILLSDLNMPHMSGFELLSVIRRRYPAMHVIAMSGAFSGDNVPPGISADAFYEKGSGIDRLMKIMEPMAQSNDQLHQHRNALEPIWLYKNGHDNAEADYVIISCTQCLRAFREKFSPVACAVCEISCPHCLSLILYAFVEETASIPSKTTALNLEPRPLIPVGNARSLHTNYKEGQPE
jgi:DNA-binding NtrC family response regulator